MSHDPLADLLRRWRHEPAAHPAFAEEVWARISVARREERGLVAFRWALPLAASLALVAGFSAARAEARRAHAERMADTYVRTVDPAHITASHGAHR